MLGFDDGAGPKAELLPVNEEVSSSHEAPPGYASGFVVSALLCVELNPPGDLARTPPFSLRQALEPPRSGREFPVPN